MCYLYGVEIRTYRDGVLTVLRPWRRHHLPARPTYSASLPKVIRPRPRHLGERKGLDAVFWSGCRGEGAARLEAVVPSGESHPSGLNVWLAQGRGDCVWSETVKVRVWSISLVGLVSRPM